MSKPVFQRPFEVSAEEYPFTDHWLEFRDGHIHYVDEGDGPTVLLLHGNPTWSYLYRNVIKELSSECRLVALDYPGFGMSKAPTGYGYTPQEHSEMLFEFITHLDLTNFVMVVQDWGGPIGMSYVVKHQDNIRGVVLMNTWAWPSTLPKVRLFSLAMGGWPIGYWLQTKMNFFAKTILPAGIFHKEKVTETLRKAYTDPFPTPRSRMPTWVFPRQIRKAGSWLATIEAELPTLSGLPTQILWGAQDSAGFPRELMERWRGYLRANETEVLDDAAHFVQEDRPDRVVAAIRRVLERTA
ncbi:alpha/beta fold hydrolase [Mycobacterium sp. URHB0044]|uniref:alpha/beta fold hydrolase n=1 Tax=Mycobacterium sp. URHB0044 TaxID=1380386 RepID=UPI0018CC781A|nr:alpha/beta fold hydrolase [Mycobacterium sp. URHB0044]